MTPGKHRAESGSAPRARAPRRTLRTAALGEIRVLSWMQLLAIVSAVVVSASRSGAPDHVTVFVVGKRVTGEREIPIDLALLVAVGSCALATVVWLWSLRSTLRSSSTLVPMAPVEFMAIAGLFGQPPAIGLLLTLWTGWPKWWITVSVCSFILIGLLETRRWRHDRTWKLTAPLDEITRATATAD